VEFRVNPFTCIRNVYGGAMFHLPIPAPIFAIGYLALSTYLMRKQFGNIGHEAHIGGALSGFLLAGLLSDQGYVPLLDRLTHLIS